MFDSAHDGSVGATVFLFDQDRALKWTVLETVPDDLETVIRRSVIDDDQFDVQPIRGLGEDGLDGSLDVPGMVVGRDDH